MPNNGNFPIIFTGLDALNLHDFLLNLRDLISMLDSDEFKKVGFQNKKIIYLWSIAVQSIGEYQHIFRPGAGLRVRHLDLADLKRKAYSL